MDAGIHIDWETFGTVDLPSIGAHKYACHKDTDILCLSWLRPGETRVGRWRPRHYFFGGNHVEYPFKGYDGYFLAWNAQFEYLIWNECAVPLYGWPEMPIDRFICVAAQARRQAVPGKLENAARFLQARYQKDMQGHQHMMKMCKPPSLKKGPDKDIEDLRKRIKTGSLALWEECLIETMGEEQALLRAHHTPPNIDLLHRYCDKDVLAEKDIESRLTPWTDFDLHSYWVNEVINATGIDIDRTFCKAAVSYADEEKEYFARRLSEITDGEVTTARQFQKIKDWVVPRMCEEAVKLTEHYDKGEKKISFDSATRSNLLDSDLLTDEVYEFVDILDQAGKSTISKYQSMLDSAFKYQDAPTPRVYGMYMYCGAAQTGRYSSTRLQLHNMKRTVHKDSINLIEAFRQGNTDYIFEQGSPIPLLSELIRPALTGGDRYLVWGDWSGIEARVLPWLSGEKSAKPLLKDYENNVDVYVRTAAEILRIKPSQVTDEQRQAYGKVTVLSMGYGGGVGAFQAMAKAYGVSISDNEAERIKTAWRETNPWAVDFWAKTEQAAMDAIENPGWTFKAGKIKYEYNESALGGLGALYCLLPSGSKLCYPAARIELIKKPWGEVSPSITSLKASWTPKQGDEENWPRTVMWYGKLVENSCQATATGCLTNAALIRAYAMGLTVCAHTHDELVIRTKTPKRGMRLLKECMETLPEWAAGLPLKAECGYGWRYKVKGSEPE